MKKLIYLLICTLLFQSCLICNLTSEQISDCLDDPDNCVYYDDLVFEIGLGKAMILGGESWVDPLGAQVTIETRFMDITDKSYLTTGLGLSYQGAGYDEYDYSGTVRLSYVNAPLMFNYKTNNGLYGEIGLQPGFLLRARDLIEGGENLSYRDWVKKVEIGLPVGGGYWVNDQISLGVRATYGILNLNSPGDIYKDHNLLVTGVANIKLFRAKRD